MLWGLQEDYLGKLLSNNIFVLGGLGRSPGERHGNPLQYSCVVNPQGQRSLVACSLWTSAKTRGFHTQLDEGPETP